MNEQHCRRELGRILDASVRAGEALLQALEREQEALRHTDSEAIETSARDKLARLQSLEALGQAREATVIEAGHTADPAGMKRCLAWCDTDGRLQRSWDRVLELVRSCRDLNRRNGASIELSRRHVQQALAVLRGQSPEPETYQPHTGDSAAGNAGRTLGRA